jgi:hypothetical protein
MMKKMVGTKAGAVQMTHEFNQQAHPLLPSLQIENSYAIRATPAQGLIK